MSKGGLKQIWTTRLTDVSDSAKEDLGSVRFENGKFYKYVKYLEGTGALDVVAGDVVFYDAGTGYTNNEVTADFSDSDPIGAGIVQATITADAKYCWILIKGEASLAQDVVAGAVGNKLTAVGAADKKLDVSALVTDPSCGILTDATAAAMKMIADFPF